MKLNTHRYGLEIVPESPQDEAFIEEVLGLHTAGQSVELVRRNAIGLGALAFLETRTPRQKMIEYDGPH